MRTRLWTTALVLTVAVLAAAPAYAVTTTNWTEYAANPVYAPGRAYYPSVTLDGGTYQMWKRLALPGRLHGAGSNEDVRVHHNSQPERVVVRRERRLVAMDGVQHSRG